MSRGFETFFPQELLPPESAGIRSVSGATGARLARTRYRSRRLDDELIGRLLPECRSSMMGTQPGFGAYDAYDGRRLAEAYAREKDGEVELLLTELEAWVKLHGGSVERRNRLRSGQRVAPDPGPPTVIFRLPRDDS